MKPKEIDFYGKISELFRCIIILWTKSTVITIHMHHIDVNKVL